jgi:hypothetical protein
MYQNNKINDKIRIRNKFELDVRKKEFLDICMLLDDIGIKYFLLGGVLLGAVRNKSFINWDWDVEICFFANDIIKKNSLFNRIDQSYFKIIKYNKNISNFKIDLVGKLPKEVTKYTLMAWNHDKKKKIFWRNKFKIPDHYLLNMKKIKLFEKKHNAPFPVKKYLTHQYGNWTTPMQTSNKNVYLSKKYYNRYNFINYIKNLLVKILERI